MVGKRKNNMGNRTKQIEYQGIPESKFQIPRQKIRFTGHLVGKRYLDKDHLKCYFITLKNEFIALIVHHKPWNPETMFNPPFTHYDFAKIKVGTKWLCTVFRTCDGKLTWVDADSLDLWSIDDSIYELNNKEK